ncbi:MAG: hypothetical protein KBG28_31400 [Kofleriaceae bacterium]|nr:hypothetical protein [Kofleriaceae bacterium]
MYRYGDGSPFPLEENFIDTLVSAVDATAAAYTPIADLDDKRERARDAKRNAERELARLAEFEESVSASIASFGPSAGRGATPIQLVAQKVLGGVHSTVAAQRTQINSQVARLEAEASADGLGARVRQALAAFFEKHQLPSTTWAVAWDARAAAPTAQAVATAGRFVATFDVALTGIWTAPVKFEALMPGITLQLPRRKMFGGAKTQPVALDRCALIAFERTGTVTTLILRENPAKPSPGWRLVEDKGAVACTALDGGADAGSEEAPLTGDDVGQVKRLGDAVAEAVMELRGARTLRELRAGNHTVDTLPSPRLAVDAVLTALSPLVRTIRERSKMSGELVLKRDIGDGRREELFVPRAEVAQKFTPLPLEYRRLYEEMGLSAEHTDVGIVISEQPTLVKIDDDP